MFSAREDFRPTNQFLEPITLSRMTSLVFQMSAIVICGEKFGVKIIDIISPFDGMKPKTTIESMILNLLGQKVLCWTGHNL